MTIDRIDVNGNYTKENCKWSSIEEQNRNKRSIIYLEFNGERRKVAEWAKMLNINLNTLKNRLFKLGWSTEKALTEPVMKSKSHRRKSK